MWDEGIKSKERVVQFGEVYTPENIVKEMLDLVKDESYRIDSKILEPAAGNGNFIVEILRRKLQTAATMPLTDYDRNVFICVSNIYAIDILKDNIAECKERMLEILMQEYELHMDKKMNYALREAIEFVLDNNIIHGNTLTGKYMEMAKEGNKEIIISEWTMALDNVERKDYIFSLMETDVFNTPIDEYETMHYLDVSKAKKKKSTDETMAEFGL